MPYWVKVVVDFTGTKSEAQSHLFDTRDEAYAELSKIKAAQAMFTDNPERYDEAANLLPDWLSVHSVGQIVVAAVEGSG